MFSPKAVSVRHVLMPSGLICAECTTFVMEGFNPPATYTLPFHTAMWELVCWLGNEVEVIKLNSSAPP